MARPPSLYTPLTAGDSITSHANWPGLSFLGGNPGNSYGISLVISAIRGANASVCHGLDGVRDTGANESVQFSEREGGREEREEKGSDMNANSLI